MYSFSLLNNIRVGKDAEKENKSGLNVQTRAKLIVDTQNKKPLFVF